jgi:Transposase, Mutator family
MKAHMTTNTTITPELLDQLLANYEKPEDLTGDGGLFKRLKKALIQRALGAELTEHLGYEKGDPAGRGKGNSRNGTSSRHAFLGPMIWVCCYVDGFNVYHAIDDMSRATRGALNHLKWLDLRKLMTVFTDPAVHEIVVVKYFSAYATWKPQQHARHQIYIKALDHSGVQVILGQFKEKDPR